MITICPMNNECHTVSNIDCEGRNFLQCGFFHNCLNEYCEKIGYHCKNCKYPAYCGAEHKKRYGKR